MAEDALDGLADGLADDPRRWVLPALLDAQATGRGAQPWLRVIGGETVGYADAAAQMHRVAGHFAALGVQPGDRVAVFAAGSAEFVRVWLGLTRLGAVAVLLNSELRGAFLEHQLADCGAALAVVDAALLPALVEVVNRVPMLRRLLVLGEAAAEAAAPLPVLPWAQWRAAAPCAAPMPAARDIACVMYTSGTSGPAKGVLMPHAHCTLYGIGAGRALALDASDVYYIALPLFHANGLLMQLGASLIAGMSAVVRPRFSASAWLDDIRRHGATVTNSLGAVAAFVIAQPPSPHDRAHRLRAVCSAPNLPAHEAAFRERFGVRDVVSAYGMTEVNIPTWGRVGASAPGSGGWIHADHFDVIVADPDTDAPLPSGTPGEILVRPKRPSGFMAGYLNRPEATVEAWRNLWFHTGDLGALGADGLLTFIDRIKDCIRRRGENIAASEVEDAVQRALPGVAEIAAFAVPASIAGGEDEVMLAVVATPGAALGPAQVAAAADAVLPRFARPRFVELFDALPKTATGKVQRAALRRRGVGASTWDREAAG